MSSVTAGKLVRYVAKDGTVHKAVARYSDNRGDRFFGRLWLRVLNDDLTEKVDATGKQVVSVRFPGEVTVIGFVD